MHHHAIRLRSSAPLPFYPTYPRLPDIQAEVSHSLPFSFSYSNTSFRLRCLKSISAYYPGNKDSGRHAQTPASQTLYDQQFF